MKTHEEIAEDEHQSRLEILLSLFYYTWLFKHEELLPYSHKALRFVVVFSSCCRYVHTLSEPQYFWRRANFRRFGLFSQRLQSLNGICFTRASLDAHNLAIIKLLA